MQNRELFRWTFAASGLWLLLSPFLLPHGATEHGDALVGDPGLLMILGLIALTVAGYGFNKHFLVQTYLGLSFGLVVAAAPWIVGFTDTLTAWNVGFVGMIMVLVGLYQVYQHMLGHHA